MTSTEAKELREATEEDERSFSTYASRSAYALIAANWAVARLPELSFKKAPFDLFKFSLFLSVLFLFVKGIGHWLNIRHSWKILDNQAAFKDDGYERTCYGRASHFLFEFDILFLVASFGCFIAGILEVF